MSDSPARAHTSDPIKIIVLRLLREARALAGGYPGWEAAALLVEPAVKG